MRWQARSEHRHSLPTRGPLLSSMALSRPTWRAYPKQCCGRCTTARSRPAGPTLFSSTPTACASTRRSTTTSSGISANPWASLARAAEIDRALRHWIERHPSGFVVSLGEGLETQVRRVDNGRLRWLSVDLPDVIRLRERFLPPTRRFRHFAGSALDPAWMDAVDVSSGVFIIAQGLLMYLEPQQVQWLLIGIAERFPGAEMVFDTIPRWFSRLTLRGLQRAPHYRLPPMPWGINRDEVEPALRRWHHRFDPVSLLNYRIPRGLQHLLARVVEQIPLVRHEVPSLVHIAVTATPDPSSAGPKPRARAAIRRTATAFYHPGKR